MANHEFPDLMSQPSIPAKPKTLLLWYWGPVVGYALLIVFLSAQSTPSQYIPGILYGLSDKILHATEYGILALLLYRAFKHTVNTKWTVGLSILTAVAFGVSDEIHQWFVPNREADFFDLLADGLGATLLVCAWAFVFEKRQISKNEKVETVPQKPD
ncbi:MAG: VanZ family protein [Nitrospirales bacterium]